MPRGKKDEITVQRDAVHLLVRHYKSQLEWHSITYQIEAVIFNECKMGKGRADGLIVARLADESIFTASVEAKSFRTLRNLEPTPLNKKRINHALVVGVTIFLLVFTTGWLLSDSFFWKWSFPLLMFFVGGSTFYGFMSENRRYRPIHVINQIKCYPANDKWIAIPSDTYNQLVAKNTQKPLLKDCRKEGIGLIQIRPGFQSSILLEPKTTWNQKSQYLDCYRKGRQLLKRLNDEVINSQFK